MRSKTRTIERWVDMCVGGGVSEKEKERNRERGREKELKRVERNQTL